MPAIICPHCGVTNRAFSNFCNNCGVDLREEEVDLNKRAIDPQDEIEGETPPFDEIAPRIPQDRELQDSQAAQGNVETTPNAAEGQGAQPEYIETFEDFSENLADRGLTPTSSGQHSSEDQATMPTVGHPDDTPPISTHPESSHERLAPAESSTTEPAILPPPTLESTTFESATVDSQQVEDTQTSDQIIVDRLVTGVRGALRPHPLINELLAGETHEVEAAINPARPTDLLETSVMASGIAGDEVRTTMSTGALLENELIPVGPPRGDSLRIPPLIWLLLGGIFIGVALNFAIPDGAVDPLPGADDALTLIESMPQNANVLVLWGYDPATAGEMDLIVQPVLQHLIDKEAQIAVVSTLPMGPAIVRRLWLDMTQQYTDIHRAGLIDLGYLPGGAAAMPLMAYTDVLGILRYGVREFGAGATVERFWPEKPDVMLVVTSQAEDIQLWLEQVQPLNDVPTIGITAASVGPIARPYWDSGQLSGLVSGFDGAASYQSQLVTQLSDTQQADRTFLLATSDSLARHMIAQNWGHLLLLLIILAGNLVFLFSPNAP